MGQVHDCLKMIDKYVALLKWEIKPQYKQFYLQASIVTFMAGRKEELYFANAEECDPEDDFVLFERLLCENMLGVMDNVRSNEDRILAFKPICRWCLWGWYVYSPMAVASWFADSELLYRVTKQSSVSLNKIPQFAHTPTLDHMIKPKLKLAICLPMCVNILPCMYRGTILPNTIVSVLKPTVFSTVPITVTQGQKHLRNPWMDTAI